MILTVLASSSQANCSIVTSGPTALMIDAGLPYGIAFKALADAGINPESLSGVLITHDHKDHSRGAQGISSKLRIPLYCTQGTAEKMTWTLSSVPKIRVFKPDLEMKIGQITVVPFSVPHDAADPVGFFLDDGTRSIAIATDLGYIPETVGAWLKGTDLVMIESSYEPTVLEKSVHDPSVKRRISSPFGHLSNDKTCEMIKQLDEKTKTIVLAHLSEKANDPEIAMLRARLAMNGHARNLFLATDMIGKPL